MYFEETTKPCQQIEILPKTKKEIHACNTQIQTDMEYLLRNVLALDQIIEFSLEEAMSLLKDDEVANNVQPIDIATKGLNRALANVDDLIEKISSTIDNGLNILASVAFEIENKLDELGDSKQIIKIKIRLTRHNPPVHRKTLEGGQNFVRLIDDLSQLRL